MTHPADEIHAAANTLRSLLDDATPGPWKSEAHATHGHRVGTANDTSWVAWTGERKEDGSEADAAYIAVMHPGVGTAIAGWLEREAFRVLHNGSNSELHHALAVAREINRAQP